MGFPPVKPRQTIPHQLRFENLPRAASFLPSVGLAIDYGLVSSGFTKLRVSGSAIWSTSSHKCPRACVHIGFSTLLAPLLKRHQLSTGYKGCPLAIPPKTSSMKHLNIYETSKTSNETKSFAN